MSNFNNKPSFNRLRLPDRKVLEMYGKVIEFMGSNNIKVMCEDGKERLCRIPGKMVKHIWIKMFDIVIVKLWDFQPEKADIVWRYLGFQKSQLEKRKELDELYKHTLDVISDVPFVNKFEKQKKEKKQKSGSYSEDIEDTE